MQKRWSHNLGSTIKRNGVRKREEEQVGARERRRIVEAKREPFFSYLRCEGRMVEAWERSSCSLHNVYLLYPLL